MFMSLAEIGWIRLHTRHQCSVGRSLYINRFCCLQYTDLKKEKKKFNYPYNSITVKIINILDSPYAIPIANIGRFIEIFEFDLCDMFFYGPFVRTCSHGRRV